MLSRQTFKFILPYALSILLFWNLVIAIRAYRFTHFSKDSTEVAKAGFWDYVSNRISGGKHYNIPITNVPNVAYETVTLKTEDDKSLESWYLPTANSKGTCIIFHGLGGNKQCMLNETYAMLQLGYNVLSVDFRAHGNSEGTATTLGAKEAADVKAAYDYIVTKGEKNIVLYGASMGAASISSCLHTYATVKPSKVILDMPFDNFEHLMERFYRDSKYPNQPTFTLFTFWASMFNNTWFFNVKPSDYVKSINCPTLVQWGKNDPLVPQESIDKVVNNIAAKKTFKVYENLAHESFALAEPDNWKKTVSAFLGN